jgi:hypothetical protein
MIAELVTGHSSLVTFLIFAGWVIAVPVILYTCLAVVDFWRRQHVRYGRCRECGCTDESCFDCIMATGESCWWVDSSHTLCSRCVNALSPEDCDDLSPDCSPLNRTHGTNRTNGRLA